MAETSNILMCGCGSRLFAALQTFTPEGAAEPLPTPQLLCGVCSRRHRLRDGRLEPMAPGYDVEGRA